MRTKVSTISKKEICHNIHIKGAMDKKADGDICTHLLCFSTDFSETLSISVFFQGVVKSDLKLTHSAHFALLFQLFWFFKVEN
jgi:hypothetical protein